MKKYGTLLIAGLVLGLISLANLAFHGRLDSKPSTGFMILAGSGMLRMIMRLRRHVG